MYKILPIILILTLFSLTGCNKPKPMFKVGQKVCVTKDQYPYPIGEIYKITEENEYIYHIKLYSPKLKSHIITRNKLEDICEFIEEEEEEEE